MLPDISLVTWIIIMFVTVLIGIIIVISLVLREAPMSEKNEHIHRFINKAIQLGHSKEDVTRSLSDAGWTPSQISDIWRQYHLSDAMPLPVPRPQQYSSPRLTAWNVLYFATLYLSIFSIIAIIFTFLDYNLPNGQGRMRGVFHSHKPFAESIREYLAMGVVCIPALIFTSRYLGRMLQQFQHIPRMRLKLIYLTFLVGVIILLSNAISFVYYGLSGTLSIRYVIKVVLLSAVAIGLHFYFKPEVQRAEKDGSV